MKTWINRCYFDGIPDEVPMKVMQSMRAPSYKAISLALLKNDIGLLGIAAPVLWKLGDSPQDYCDVQLNLFEPRVRGA